MADSQTFVSNSSTAGEVGGGILNRILVDGAPFGLLHPVPPSVKLQHNRWEAARIQGGGAPFGLLHPAPPSRKLWHNQAAAWILGDGTPFGLGDPPVIGGREMQVAAAGL
jgi:hypothetical protein